VFSSDDTIVAIATPSGRGGIGVVRISGLRATEIAAKVLTRQSPWVPRQATLTKVRLNSGGSTRIGDHAIVTWFPSPHSYTGEHVVEISTHGSPVVLRGILSSLVAAGARLARPGEFTFRAFLNARIDLVQAEAVADLIEAATPLQAQVAFDQLEGALSTRIDALDRRLLDLVARLEASLDFPDEGFHFIEPHAVASRIGDALDELNAVLAYESRGRLIREGATVVIAGRVNVGKSSLFNALIGQDRAIVTDVPGTTRDFLTETIDLDGLAVTLVDTAGERQTNDAIELEGVARAVRARDRADLVLIVVDSGEELTPDDCHLLGSASPTARLIVASKSDREPKWEMAGAIRVSTIRNEGLNDLRCAIVRSLTGEEGLCDPAAITNLRHVMLLKEARSALMRARTAIEDQDAPEEFVLVDLHRARASFGEVLGMGSSEETLDYIFNHFCIGK
jgi:tRNA modification GTPase